MTKSAVDRLCDAAPRCERAPDAMSLSPLRVSVLNDLEALTEHVECLSALRLSGLARLADQAEDLLELLRLAVPVQTLLDREFEALADHLWTLEGQRGILEGLLELVDWTASATAVAESVRGLRSEAESLREWLHELESSEQPDWLSPVV